MRLAIALFFLAFAALSTARFFSDDWIFNQRVAGDAKVNPNSTGWIDFAIESRYLNGMLEFGGNSKEVTGYDRALRENGEIAIIHAKTSDALYSIYEICSVTNYCQQGGWGKSPNQGRKIHIPKWAVPAGGFAGTVKPSLLASRNHYVHDAHLSVIQPDGVTCYDFWGVWVLTGDSSFSMGGVTVPPHSIGALSAGHVDVRGQGNAIVGGGGIAASWSQIAGVIMYSELAAADHNPVNAIPHALTFDVPYTTGTVYPCNLQNNGVTVSGKTAANYPPMGARFHLDMTDAEIAKLKLPKWHQAIVYALAHYGAFVSDTNGGDQGSMGHIQTSNSFNLKATTSPWYHWAEKHGFASYEDQQGRAWVGLSKGRSRSPNFLDSLPLHKFRVVMPETSE